MKIFENLKLKRQNELLEGELRTTEVVLNQYRETNEKMTKEFTQLKLITDQALKENQDKEKEIEKLNKQLKKQDKKMKTLEKDLKTRNEELANFENNMQVLINTIDNLKEICNESNAKVVSKTKILKELGE